VVAGRFYSVRAARASADRRRSWTSEVKRQWLDVTCKCSGRRAFEARVSYPDQEERTMLALRCGPASASRNGRAGFDRGKAEHRFQAGLSPEGLTDCAFVCRTGCCRQLPGLRFPAEFADVCAVTASRTVRILITQELGAAARWRTGRSGPADTARSALRPRVARLCSNDQSGRSPRLR